MNKTTATIITVNETNFLYFLNHPEEIGEDFVIENTDAITVMLSNRELDPAQLEKWKNHCSGMSIMLDTLYYKHNNILGLAKNEYEGLKAALPLHDIGKALMPELFSFAGVFSKFQKAAKEFHAIVGAKYLEKHPKLLGTHKKITLRVIKEHHSVSKYFPSQVIKALDVFQSLMANDATRSYQDPEIAKKAKKIVFEFEKGLHNEKIMNILFALYEKGELPVVMQDEVHA